MLKRPQFLYRNVSTEVPPDMSFGEELAALIKKHKGQKAPQADDDEEESQPPIPPLWIPLPGQQELDSRGIIFINSDITKQALEAPSRLLLNLYYDQDFDDRIDIILNSPGGYLDAGWAFIDLMNFVGERLKIHTVAMGAICSMATMIFIAGDDRTMAANSVAMIHQFSNVSYGNYADLLASRKSEDIAHQQMIDHFILHSKYTTKKQIEEKILTSTDNWLTPTEMKKHGLCDHVIKAKRK